MFLFSEALYSVNQNGKATVHHINDFNAFVKFIQRVYILFKKRQISIKEILLKCPDLKGQLTYGSSLNDVTECLEDLGVTNFYIFSNENGEVFSTVAESPEKSPRIFATLDENPKNKFLGKISLFRTISDHFTVNSSAIKAIADLKKIEENKRSDTSAISKRTSRKISKKQKSSILDETAAEKDKTPPDSNIIQPFTSLQVSNDAPIETNQKSQTNFHGRSLRSLKMQKILNKKKLRNLKVMGTGKKIRF